MAVDHKAFLNTGDLGKVERKRAAVIMDIRKAKYKTRHEEHHTHEEKLLGSVSPKQIATLLIL